MTHLTFVTRTTSMTHSTTPIFTHSDMTRMTYMTSYN